MLCRRRFMGTVALALLTGGLPAGCRHRPQDQPDSGQRPSRADSGGDRGGEGGNGGGY